MINSLANVVAKTPPLQDRHVNVAKNFILDLTLSQGGECFFFYRSVITSLLHFSSWLSQGFSDNGKMCSR